MIESISPVPDLPLHAGKREELSSCPTRRSTSCTASSLPARRCFARVPRRRKKRSSSQHFDYLKALTVQGVVVLAGRTLNTDESSFGIVILTAASEDAARAIMHNDPAVKQGVMRAELFPYRIALMASGQPAAR